ncbi:acetyl-CoA synthetase-like protein [Aspergillus steynii IBT 23096]|uniref:Acetyl-CoA synthetase-like protein n=1 Tax=Aspergillus steynii IBT 23096 TaxID=1392250 RepID=A0A2I2GM85_9EURO|nr:acetyl-CoA synthetase-like protein [Aspergillus steynii IBT 23096]PLB53987.1 acetyl-CoA synthetase-like protein [Aspergillus steynii IBT 23096]
MISPIAPISHDVVTFALDARADYDASEPLFIDAQDPSRSLNGVQFPFLVRTLIAGLKAHGVGKGDCVVVHTGNNVLYTALFLAIIGTGGIYMGSNPHSSVDEFNRVVHLTKPRLILTEEEALSTVLAVSDKNNISSNNIFLINDASIDATIAFTHGQEQPSIPTKTTQSSLPTILSFLSDKTADPALIVDPETAKATPAALYLTSGTTGLPKAAVLTHAALIARHQAILYTPPYKVSRLICLPIFHVFSSLWTHLFPIRYGHPLYILRGFQMPVFLDTVRRYQISETYLVPVVVHALNQAPASLDVVASLSSLRYIGLSGAPIDRDSMTAFQDILHPDACAGQVWGMTECGVVIQNRYPESGRSGQGDLGSIGRVLPGYEAKLVSTAAVGDSEERPTREVVEGQNVSGQLHVRGPGLFNEYLGQEEAVVDDQGWFSTGDVAYVNAEGDYVIVGRTKELIKVRGYQVSPAEIEAVLLKHPLITDIAVMGITLADGSTEAPRAYVVRTGGTKGKLTAEEVFDFVQQRLASYKVLDGGVYFVERIPRTVNGKLQRGKLAKLNEQREMLAGLLGKLKAAN